MKSKMVNQTERHSCINSHHQRCPARGEAEKNQYRADSIGEQGESQAWNHADMNRVGKVRGHSGKAGDLLPAMTPEQTESHHEPK